MGSDADGFDELFRREYPAIVASARAILGDSDAARDVAQEAFIRLFVRWQRISRYDRPGAWVRLVAVRLALREQRRASRFRAARATDGGSPEASDSRVPAVLAAIDELSPMQRAAVTMYYLQDFTIPEVAARLGCAESTVRVHLHRGRERLTAALIVDDEP